MRQTTTLDSWLIKYKDDKDSVYFLHVKDKKGNDCSYRVASSDWLFKWLESIEI